MKRITGQARGSVKRHSRDFGSDLFLVLTAIGVSAFLTRTRRLQAQIAAGGSNSLTYMQLGFFYTWITEQFGLRQFDYDECNDFRLKTEEGNLTSGYPLVK